MSLTGATKLRGEEREQHRYYGSGRAKGRLIPIASHELLRVNCIVVGLRGQEERHPLTKLRQRGERVLAGWQSAFCD